MKPYPLYSNTPFSTIRELIDLNAGKYRDAAAYSWQAKDKQITSPTYLQTQQDIGMNSLEQMEMVVNLEEEFNVEISDREAMQLVTVGDVIKMLEAKK